MHKSHSIYVANRNMIGFKSLNLVYSTLGVYQIIKMLIGTYKANTFPCATNTYENSIGTFMEIELHEIL